MYAGRARSPSGLQVLTIRQAAALVVGLMLASGGLVSVVAGRLTLAIGLTGLLTFVVLAGMVQLRRRLEQARWALGNEIAARGRLLAEHRNEVAGRLDRIDAVQRRILASVEEERLTAAEFRSEALVAIHANQATPPPGRGVPPTQATSTGRPADPQ